ncbi:MAG: hypothetical protein ABIC40_01290, partial [bacterium]
MQLGLRIEQKQTLKLKPTLQQLQYYRLLQQTNLELEEDIREELSQNPALEVEEIRRCPRCGEILFEGQPCVTCISGKVEDDDREGISSEKLDMLEEIYSSSSGTYEASTYESIPEDDLPDTFATVVRPITLEDHLKRRLPIDCNDLSDEEQFLAVDLIDHIDTVNDYSIGGEEEFEHIAKQHIKIDTPGLIRMTDEVLAEELDARVETIKKVRRRVAEMDPVGS